MSSEIDPKNIKNAKRHLEDAVKGKIPPLGEIRNKLLLHAMNDSPCLLIGPIGMGKTYLAEKMAEARHILLCGEFPNKERKAVFFQKLNAGNLRMNEDRWASDLFGYVEGAFTGAGKGKDGAFKTVEKGIIFIDEAQELLKSEKIMPSLLNVMEDKDRSFSRLGMTEKRDPFNGKLVLAIPSDEITDEFDKMEKSIIIDKTKIKLNEKSPGFASRIFDQGGAIVIYSLREVERIIDQICDEELKKIRKKYNDGDINRIMKVIHRGIENDIFNSIRPIRGFLDNIYKLTPFFDQRGHDIDEIVSGVLNFMNIDPGQRDSSFSPGEITPLHEQEAITTGQDREAAEAINLFKPSPEEDEGLGQPSQEKTTFINKEDTFIKLAVELCVKEERRSLYGLIKDKTIQMKAVLIHARDKTNKDFNDCTKEEQEAICKDLGAKWDTVYSDMSRYKKSKTSI